jgi:hypothetical protein
MSAARLDPAAIPRATVRAAFQVVAGEGVLLHVPNARLCGLNEAGTFVLSQIDGRRSCAELAAALATRYGIELARALADLGRLLEKLRERDLVELLPAKVASSPGSGPAPGQQP